MILFVLACSAGWGQSCTLAGVVYDAQTKEPLAFAAVYLGDKTIGASTDAEGHFALAGVPCADSLSLAVSLIGYTPAGRRVAARGKGLIKFYLQSQNLDIVDVEFVYHIIGAQTTGQSVAVLDQKALAPLQGLPLAEQLATVPGVSAIHSGPTVAKPVIHGLYGNRILIVNNGVRLEGQQWGTDHAPELDPYGAAQLQVVRGASSLRYGADAVGGVILADAPRLPCAQVGVGGRASLAGVSNGRGGAGALSLEGGAGGRLTGLGWRVQGSGRRAGYVRTPTYYLDNTSLAEGNYSAAIGYTRPRLGINAFFSSYNTQLGLFSGASVGSLSDLTDALARPAPIYQPDFSYRLGRPYQQVRHQLGKVQGHYHFTDLTSLDVIYALQQDRRREYDLVPLSGRTSPELDLDLATQSLTAELHHHLAPGLAGVAGAQGITQRNIWAGQFLLPNYRSYAGGAFITEKYALPNLTLEAGARVDYKWLRSYFFNERTLVTYNRTRTFLRPSISLGADYTGLPIRLSLNAGTAWRAPSANELYSNGVHQSAVSFERGNPDMHSEVAYNLSLTAALARGPVSAEVTGYANRMDGYIYLRPDSMPVRTIRGAFPAFSYRQTDALLTGFDAQAAWALGGTPGKGLSLKHKSAFLWAHDRRTGGYLFFIPANRLEHALRYDLASGRLARMAPYAQAALVTVLRQYRAPANADYAPPPAAYTLLGLEAGITARRGGGKDVSIILSVTNALNTRYRDYLNRFRYFTDDAGRNIALRVSITI